MSIAISALADEINWPVADVLETAGQLAVIDGPAAVWVDDDTVTGEAAATMRANAEQLRAYGDS